MSEVKYSALVVAWIGAWYLAGVMEYAPYTSLWYLPAGLSMAAFIVLGNIVQTQQLSPEPIAKLFCYCC